MNTRVNSDIEAEYCFQIVKEGELTVNKTSQSGINVNPNCANTCQHRFRNIHPILYI